MLLVVFIPVVWSIVTIMCLSVCAMAARGDAAPERNIERPLLASCRLSAARRAGAPQLRLLDNRRAS